MQDADAEVEGAPGAPLDVRCLDANKDYIIVTWKQPAVDGGNSILGYFVDRSVSMLLPVVTLTLLKNVCQSSHFNFIFIKAPRRVKGMIADILIFSVDD